LLESWELIEFAHHALCAEVRDWCVTVEPYVIESEFGHNDVFTLEEWS